MNSTEGPASGRRVARLSRIWHGIRPVQSRLPWHAIVAASLAGAVTIGVLGVSGALVGRPILIAAFGSSCVLVFLQPDAPLSQPINVIGGHLVSAIAGLVVHALLPVTWWSIGISVGVAMAAMAAARVVHPPAGGTPIAIMLTHQGWGYLFTPVLVGAVILTACALVYRLLLRWVATRR